MDIREGDPCEVVTRKGTAQARHVVVATPFSMSDPGFYVARMYPSRSCAMADRLHGAVQKDLEKEPRD